ncbi:MAG: arginine N-succinyltransferase, partial [Pirellulales bacterium]
MIVVRPVQMRDVDSIASLAQRAEAGLTTLPKDRSLLEERVRRACESFARHVDKPEGEPYLLVGEDSETGRLIGTSGIVSRVGGFEPFYAYEVRTDVYQSKQLNIRREIPALYLSAEHDGPSEIGTLFVDPGQRGAGLGALLSKTRFLFMAEYRQAFASPVIAELRGVSDQQGRPPFWEAIGRHFFEIDFAHADYLSVQDKKFIAELMPTHPIYIPLLPPEAQRAIGQVHEKTRPALEILKQEGFVLGGKVDIFDAGPIVVCPLDRIRSVRDSSRQR